MNKYSELAKMLEARKNTFRASEKGLLVRTWKGTKALIRDESRNEEVLAEEVKNLLSK